MACEGMANGVCGAAVEVVVAVLAGLALFGCHDGRGARPQHSTDFAGGAVQIPVDAQAQPLPQTDGNGASAPVASAAPTESSTWADSSEETWVVPRSEQRTSIIGLLKPGRGEPRLVPQWRLYSLDYAAFEKSFPIASPADQDHFRKALADIPARSPESLAEVAEVLIAEGIQYDGLDPEVADTLDEFVSGLVISPLMVQRLSIREGATLSQTPVADVVLEAEKQELRITRVELLRWGRRHSTKHAPSHVCSAYALLSPAEVVGLDADLRQVRKLKLRWKGPDPLQGLETTTAAAVSEHRALLAVAQCPAAAGPTPAP